MRSTFLSRPILRPRVGVLGVLLLLSLGALAGCLDPEPAQGAGDGGDPVFDGAARPGFVAGRAVVAVIDTGANPYHEDFRRPGRAQADQLLSGYPESALTLPLTLDAGDLAAAHRADAGLWGLVEEERLYDVPGTAFVGLIAFGEPTPAPGAQGGAPGRDETGHGTASAGMVQAACPACLIVAVETGGATDGRTALAWAAGQDWIDVVVYPARAGIGFVGGGLHATGLEGTEEFAWARDNAEAGQVVVAAAGNGWPSVGGSPTVPYAPARDLSYSYWTAGPDWVLTVGAAAADRREASTWHTFPVDVVAQGIACDAPHPFSVDERVAFEGTSCSAPLVAGQVGAVLAAVRDAVRDPSTGPRSGQRLVVPETIDRPVVTREDLTRAYLLAAGPLATGAAPVTLPDPTDPATWSTGDGAAAPLYGGWGLHDAASLEHAVAVLLGDAAVPVPSAPEEAWFPVDQRIRLALWGEWDRGESRIGFPAPYSGPVKVPEDVAGLHALYGAAVTTP